MGYISSAVFFGSLLLSLAGSPWHKLDPSTHHSHAHHPLKGAKDPRKRGSKALVESTTPKKHLHPTSSQGISPKKIAASRGPLKFLQFTIQIYYTLFFCFEVRRNTVGSKLLANSFNSLFKCKKKSDCSPCNCFPFTF